MPSDVMENGRAKLVAQLVAGGMDEKEIVEITGFKIPEVKRMIAETAGEGVTPIRATLTPRAPVPAVKVSLPDISAEVQGYLDQSMAPNTRRAYESAFRQFETWCGLRKLVSLPATANTCAAYLASMAIAGKRASSIDVTRAAMRKFHLGAGYADVTADPRIEQTLKGIRREHGTAKHFKTPIMLSQVKAMLATLHRQTLAGKRDAALLLLAFATASRRSEIVNLQVSDLEPREEGYLVHIRHSKTDQAGAGMEKAVVFGAHTSTCPVLAVREWLEASGIMDGLLFRSVSQGGVIGGSLSDKAMYNIVKRMATDAGLHAGKFGCHSLRSGALTEGAKRGVSLLDLMRLSGHKSVETVQKYVHRATVFDDTPAGKIGL